MRPRAMALLTPQRSWRNDWSVRPASPGPASTVSRFMGVRPARAGPDVGPAPGGRSEGSDGLGLVVEDLEHEVQRHDRHDLVDRLARHDDLDVAALRRRALLHRDQLA